MNLTRPTNSRNLRQDRRTASLVDLALNFSASHGDAAVARALSEFKVPVHVALRVLNRFPERRRRH